MQISLNSPLFQQAMPLMQQINQAGFEAYFVGGCIRDTLLGHAIHDIDIASSARPEEIEALFRVTIDIGKEHGTIIVVEQGQHFEITTFRTEGNYSDHRRPDEVSFVRNLEEDTLRRDFTINALASDVNGMIYDYHGGLADLQAGEIRAVGSPKERFSEDALRMLRGIRFASQLGFTIEEETFAAIQALSPHIQYIAVERIRVEMNKFLLGDYFKQAAPLLVQSHLLSYFPGLAALEDACLQRIMDKMGKALQPYIDAGMARDDRLVWALLLLFLPETIEGALFLRCWSHSNQFIQETLQLVELYPQIIAQQLH